MNVFLEYEPGQLQRYLCKISKILDIFQASHGRNIQGVQDQKCQKEMAISQEGSIFDTTLVKPKCVWKLYISFAKS